MINPSVKYIGQKIKELRTINHISQSQLAERLNLSDSVISSYERGTRTPSLMVLYQIAELFNVNPDYFSKKHDNQSKRHIIDLTDLTEEQVMIVNQIVNEFIKYNKLKNKKD